MADERPPYARELPPLPPDVAHELLVFSRAIKEGSYGFRDFAIEYGRPGAAHRARYIALGDAWVAAVARSWDALKARIEGDKGP